MKWTQLFMVLVVAALAFGGSFSCRGDTDGDDDDEVIVTNSRN